MPHAALRPPRAPSASRPAVPPRVCASVCARTASWRVIGDTVHHFIPSRCPAEAANMQVSSSHGKPKVGMHERRSDGNCNLLRASNAHRDAVVTKDGAAWCLELL
jgi:hypothetical protein